MNVEGLTRSAVGSNFTKHVHLSSNNYNTQNKTFTSKTLNCATITNKLTKSQKNDKLLTKLSFLNKLSYGCKKIPAFICLYIQ